ncbi:ankyrin repeat and fibronectin type-III domain-containing protein 1 isoform X7 [Bombus pascuorum]|uniref:ankyrin repeat and fibronectin type-III domain-containing protein 1 isoform X7 n=1 Tax=Bombus pascuorum TaxID=65598 RepID=UPI00298E3EA3|nr:ankyrin repeat and fibronectin type-III domain-containing protein 1 isoform X7 [Bombus pascuorum]
MIGRGGRRYEGWAVLGGLGRRMSSGDKASPGLTIDRAAFLLLRVKKAFKKKKQQRKEKSIPTVECKTESRSARGPGGRPAPLLRSRTLPAIVAPGLSILQAQIDARYNEYNALLMITAASAGLSVPESGTSTKRGSTVSHCTKLLTPRISFTDDTIERRVSDSGPTRESSKEHSTRSGRLSTSSIGGSQPLTRLARLLNQRPSFTPSDEIPRRLSWERRDCSATSSCLPRSSSIDSVAEWSIAGGVGTVSASNAVNAGSSYGLFADQPPPRRSPSPLLGARSDRLSLVSPNIGRRVKGHRAVLALFAAVEHGHLDKARTILESTDVDVNSVNSDGLSPLDVAVLSNNRPLAKMLVAFGAQEGNQFKSPESLGSHLASLLLEAEHRVQELGGSTSGSGGTTLLEPPSSHRSSFSSQHNNLTGCGGSAEDKQLALWERRARALRKMLLGFDQARPPDMPFLVAVDVTGTNSVTVRFQEPDSHDSPICTKFKVQWSIKEDFSVICGEREVLDMKQRECRIDDLIQGQKYYFRAAAGNLKGYSRFRNSTPAHVTPSSWRDIDGRVPRFAGRLEQLNTLFTDIRRPEYTQETPAVQRRNHKKKTTIKQLFSATSKFQKNLRRGVFLACLLYHEDKILVTNEDFLPVIEVDETYPSCIYNDFHWLMKVGCTWDDVKILRQNMEKSHSSSTNHFRIKLLQAAAQMQAALCIQDIGQLYHKPIRDVQGTLVFSTVNYVKSPKLISVLNSRWLPLSKVTKKVIIHEDSNVADILIASIQEQMTYHQVSSIKLSKGLYLGYLKMQSSVDLIQVVVPAKSPNVLPHCKIRDNPHVSAEEWDYLKRITRIHASDASVKDCEEKENVTNEAQGTEQQKLFVDLVAATARRLFNYMEISPEDSLLHRLYDAEVIDLTHDVSFLIAVPPAETACCVPGTREILLQRGDLLSLPIQVFEMVHLNTYQKDVINRYSRLSCILELDTAQAQYNHREAFSSLELSVAKDKLARLQDLQTQVNTVWKGARWLIDVITFARDRGSSQQSGSSQTVGISMKHLLSLDRNRSNSNSLKRSLLQLPPRDPKLVKSSPGRGSWPGPNMSNSSSNLLTTEFSKSEQQLPSGQYIRKGSNTSNVSAGSEPAKSTVPMSSPSNLSNATSTGSNNHLVPLQNTRLPPSKSEDTLILTKYKHSPRNRSATITSASASTSPLLSIKPMIYGGSLLSVSTAMTNTTSLLSVSNTNSDSLHSLSSDEYSTPNSSVCIKSGHTKSKPTKPTASVAATATGSLESQLEEEKDEATLMPAPLPGILQVYAAYETGLASGTSLKLHVTPRTTAREVVNLVVKQLNMAVVLKGQEGPIYTADELPNFCLVAVIGARERCLRDDFKLLQLQNPWKKGRLYVRQKQDVLAALEHSSKHTAYL